MRVSQIFPVLFLSLFTLVACDVSKSLEQHQADAQQSMENNDYKTAIISLKNALQSHPEDAKSRYLLGKSYLRSGDVNGAKEIARKLKDKDFYDECSGSTKENYKKYYSEEKFLEHWNRIWD